MSLPHLAPWLGQLEGSAHAVLECFLQDSHTSYLVALTVRVSVPRCPYEGVKASWPQKCQLRPSHPVGRASH